MSDQLTGEEEHAALDDDLSRWKREAREWVGRDGRSGRDETVARLLDERESAQDHAAAADELRPQARDEEQSDGGR